VSYRLLNLGFTFHASMREIKFLVDPKDIAALAVFLASDVAKSIFGQMIPIDGDMQRN